MIGAAYSPRQRPAAYPLMKEAWERQRRRRLRLAWTACAVLAGAVLGVGLGPRLPFLGQGAAATSATATYAEIAATVDRTITAFDADLATGKYAAACSLLDPVVGTADLRADTDAVGLHGSCPQRLAGFARIVGPRLLSELNSAWTRALQLDGRWAIQYARTRSGGFEAAAGFSVPDPTLSRDLSIQNVGVERANRDAPALITSPPLISSGPWGSTFLVDYLRYKRFVRQAT
jgi:hypothetical protein